MHIRVYLPPGPLCGGPPPGPSAAGLRFEPIRGPQTINRLINRLINSNSNSNRVLFINLPPLVLGRTFVGNLPPLVVGRTFFGDLPFLYKKRPT